jgi:PAS domain S-box-containing protein
LVGRAPGHGPASSTGPHPVATNGLSAIAVAAVTMNVDGVVVDFDEGAERLTGYARSEAIGTHLSDLLIPPRLRPAHEAGLRRYRETGEAPVLGTRFLMPALCRDGTEITVELVVSRAPDQPGFVGRLRQVTRAQPVPGELALHADFHRAVVEQSPIMVFVLDEDGTGVWAAPAAEQVFGPVRGRTADQITTDMIHPSDVELIRTARHNAIAGTGDDPVELRVRQPDGTWRAVSVQARNLLDHPSVHGLVYYATDVTRARVAERQRRVEATRLMTLLESLNVGVLLQDERRRVVLTNAAFVELFETGLPPGPRDGISQLYDQPESAQTRTDEIVARGRPVMSEEVRLASGRVLERDYTPITMDGATLGHLWVYRDVTVQAQIRQSLEERNRLLSELATLKTEFVAVVSHELRTPLTSINTFASMLEEETLPTGERRAALAALKRNTDRMLSLVADLILLAKLESGEFELAAAPVDLPALVRAAVAETDPAVRLAADLVDGPAVTGDPALLHQLVTTVLGAMIAGSAADAEIQVAVRPENGCWRLTVSTSASEAATAERLLSMRLPHPDEPAEQRTGALAVMLARAIATRHDGDLSMTVEQPGARITVTLPG